MENKTNKKPEDTANPGNQYAPNNKMPQSERKGKTKRSPKTINTNTKTIMDE